MKRDVMERLRDATPRAVREASMETVRARLEWLFAPQNRHLISDELVAVRYDIYTLPDAERTVENVLVLQDPEVRERYTWAPEWCARITAPTLIFWTDQDPTGPPARESCSSSGSPTRACSCSPAPGTGRSGSARRTLTASTASSSPR